MFALEGALATASDLVYTMGSPATVTWTFSGPMGAHLSLSLLHGTVAVRSDAIAS